MLRPDWMLSALNTVYFICVGVIWLFHLCFTIPAIITIRECTRYLELNPPQSHQVQLGLIWTGQLCQEWEEKLLFLRRLCSLSWVPASVQVWTLGLCVCWSASRRCRDHMRDLKQPNRPVITANHDGRWIVKGAYRWLSVWWGEAQIVLPLTNHFSNAKPQ